MKEYVLLKRIQFWAKIMILSTLSVKIVLWHFYTIDSYYALVIFTTYKPTNAS